MEELKPFPNRELYWKPHRAAKIFALPSEDRSTLGCSLEGLHKFFDLGRLFYRIVCLSEFYFGIYCYNGAKFKNLST